MNQHWTNRNEERAFPLDDAALAINERSERLPSNLIVDLNLRWPNYLGNYAFLAGISVTAASISVAIQSAISLESTDFAPLCVLSVRKPVRDGYVYALKPQVPGVAGWITFGSGVADLIYSGRFTPQAGFFTPRAARAYRNLPVQDIGLLHAESALTGLVLFKTETPLKMAVESRDVHGAQRDCIVLRLDDGSDKFPVPEEIVRASNAKPKNIFSVYAGPCAGRPESESCGEPAPIQFLNTVSPDCEGKITLRFKGCAQVTEIQAPAGIALDCGIGLVDACLPPLLPSSDGVLPSEYDPANIPPFEPGVPDISGDSASAPGAVSLPYVNCFAAGGGDSTVQVGRWEGVFADSDYDCAADASLSVSQSGSLASATAATRNVITFGLNTPTIFRRIQTDVRLLAGPDGAKRNGGVVLNYRAHPTNLDQYVYLIAEVDYDTQTLKISRFNGTLFQTLLSANLIGLQLDHWYRLYATVKAASADQVTIYASVAETSGLELAHLVVTTSLYGEPDGQFGLCTNRALSYFSYVAVSAEL